VVRRRAEEIASFGELVRTRRGDLGLTQREVAERCGVSRNYIVMIERQGTPPPSDEVVERLEGVLKFKPGTLSAVAHLERTPSDVRDRLDRNLRDLDKLRQDHSRLVTALFEALASGALAMEDKGGFEKSFRPHGAEVNMILKLIKDRKPASRRELRDIVEKLPFAKRRILAEEFTSYLDKKMEKQLAKTETMGTAQKKVRDLRGRMKALERSNAFSVSETVSVPVISRTAAGDPRDFTDGGYPPGFAEESVEVPSGLSDRNAFALRIIGDSMAPLYQTGDVVVVNPNMTAAEGMRVVAKVRTGEVTCKGLKRLDEESVVLVSRNKKYPDQVYLRSEVEWLYPVVRMIRSEV